MSIIDKIAYSNALTNKSTSLKLMVGMFFLTISLIFNNIYLRLGIIVIVPLILILLAKIPPKLLYKVLFHPLFIIFIFSIFVLVKISPASLDLFSIRIFSINFGVDKVSLVEFINILTRTTASFLGLIFISLTSPMADLIKVMKKVHLPDIIIEQVIFIYRFIGIFLREKEEMEMAIALRQGYSNRKKWLNSTALVANELFSRIVISLTDWSRALDLKIYRGKIK